MTPQQLKALLPTSNTAESSNDSTTNNTEKLYNFAQLGIHFEIHENAIRFYAKENNIIPSKILPAKNGFYRYFKLSDFKNYKPLRRFKKCISPIINKDNYNYTVLQIANIYKVNRHNINSYIRNRKISYVTKPAKSRGIGSCVQLRHVKLEDFDFLKKVKSEPRKEFKEFTLFQRIKLLFGFDI
jgi:hypothetical protein